MSTPFPKLELAVDRIPPCPHGTLSKATCAIHECMDCLHYAASFSKVYVFRAIQFDPGVRASVLPARGRPRSPCVASCSPSSSRERRESCTENSFDWPKRRLAAEVGIVMDLPVHSLAMASADPSWAPHCPCRRRTDPANPG